ncbi:hypothetical protein PDJAM_G00094030 [Pangasius djambal]|uniref:Uncharacterized protein n=1 Tax=Pangasius djambal TaxID=1691987 RepID=A0ACC5Z741_9TELE|nr:hypothetical protein [Pangasius djambal]
MSRRSGVQSVFQFIPKVFSGVEVRALCRTLEFFHSNLHTPRLHGARFVHRGIVMLEQPIPSPNPTPDSAETHDLVLKSQLNKDILKSKKTPAVEELAKMFYTTKHRWYPVGQYHTRRRNQNPPKDR